MRPCVALLLVLAAAPGVSAQTSKLSDPSQLTETAPAVFRARFETTKGPFVIEVHRNGRRLARTASTTW